MSCKECGDCCLFIQVNMKHNAFDEEFIDFLKKTRPSGAFFSTDKKKMKIVMPCIHFDRATNLCKTYEDRPDKCKKYTCEKATR